MSGRAILLLFILCTAISVSLYKRKGAKQGHELDRVKSGLSVIDTILPFNTSISFQCPASQIELYMSSRYVLAPRYITYNKDHDTTLSIHSLSEEDSLLKGDSTNKRILYCNKDDKYLYLLTAKQILP